jgi:hypothetical protein
MFARKLAFTGALSVILAGASVTAASAAPPPGDPWTRTAVSSTGGATTYVEIDSSGTITDGMVCDTKADGHHAYGEVQYSEDGGAHWYMAESAEEYGGFNTCADLTFTIMRHYPMLRAMAETKEKGNMVGQKGFSSVWRIG